MRPNSTLSTLFGLALLAGLAYALWYLARLGLGAFEGAAAGERTLAWAAIILIVCAAIIANGLHAVARREDARQQRAARGATYEHVLRLRATRGGILTDDERAAEQLMLLYASPAVLRAYLRLRSAHDAGAAQEELAELVRAMRRDLGQRGTDASADELAEFLTPTGRPRVRLGTTDVMHG